MRVGIVGAGPGGLFLATLLRRADPSFEVTVFERNRAEDTFGFGVVFSDRTLAGIHAADPVLREALTEHGRHWDDIEVRLKGERIRCGGNGMAAISRHTLLRLLQRRAAGCGARLRFGTEVRLAELDSFDLVVGADGTGSTIRRELADTHGVDLGESVQTASAKFIWFGTDYPFAGLTFVHERGPHGVFAVHGYPISDQVSTFIVETDEASWRAAGLDEFDVSAPPGPSDERSRAYLEQLYAGQLDGHRLLVNNSRWGNFRTRRTTRWQVLEPRPAALLGDAVHTAHFSVGSGTKMAMEDAVALSEALLRHPTDLAKALSRYDAEARPSVEAIQGSAQPSLSWWEHFGRYHEAFEPWQFSYHFLTRSITDARLARRDPAFVRDAHRQWVARHGAEPLASPPTAAGRQFSRRVLAAPPPEAVRLTAPATASGLAPALAELGHVVRGGAALIAVAGGTEFTRLRLTETARLTWGVPSVLVDEDADADHALTWLLSGRADLVASGALARSLRNDGADRNDRDPARSPR